MKLFLGFYYKIISNKNFLHKNSYVMLTLKIAIIFLLVYY
jgi:hypothetical protein